MEMKQNIKRIKRQRICIQYVFVYLGTDISPLAVFSRLQRSDTTAFLPLGQEVVTCVELHK